MKQAKHDNKRKARAFEATTYSKAEITHLIPQGVLPEGETVLLVGQKGTLKSQMVYRLIACVTSGTDFAEEVLPAKKGRAILFNSERSIHKVIRPRLEAAGAELTRVQIVPWTECKDFQQAEDFIKRELKGDEEHKNPDDKLRLVVFDVVTSFKKATASDVREAILPISDLCEANGITVVFVLHLLHKGTSEKSLMGMISGSQSWVQVCSTILAMAMIDESSQFQFPKTPFFEGVTRAGVFEVSHTNLGQGNQRWWYKSEGKSVEGLNTPQSTLVTGDVSGRTSVMTLLRLGDQQDGDASNKSPRLKCRQFLFDWLNEEAGPVPSEIVQEGARREVRVKAARPSKELKSAVVAAKGEIKWRTLERARDEMAAMKQLYSWQVGGRWWVVIPDVVPNVVKAGGGATGMKNGGKDEPEDHESRLGDQGQAVH